MVSEEPCERLPKIKCNSTKKIITIENNVQSANEDPSNLVLTRKVDRTQVTSEKNSGHSYKEPCPKLLRTYARNFQILDKVICTCIGTPPDK